MDKDTARYRLSQFDKIGTEYHEFCPKIKIIKPNGETNWMDINEAELKKIKTILTGGRIW